MKTRHSILLAIAAVLVVVFYPPAKTWWKGAAPVTASSSTSSDSPNPAKPILYSADESYVFRGERYCGFYNLVYRFPFYLTAHVYNTGAINGCPASCYDKLDRDTFHKLAGEVLNETVLLTFFNGPRYWTMDTVRTTEIHDDIRRFDCLDARLVAKIPCGFSDLYQWVQPYRVRLINRKTVYFFNAGKPTFRITNPEGDVFIMQSYTTMVWEELSLDNLADIWTLGKLELPEGWRYDVVVPEQHYALGTEDGNAYVIQDNLKNTYQKMVGSYVNYLEVEVQETLMGVGLDADGEDTEKSQA